MNWLRKKIIPVFIVSGCTAGLFWFFLSNTGGQVKKLQTELRSLEKTINEMDEKIHSLSYTSAGRILLDSLKTLQQSKWAEYQICRTNLIAAVERSPKSIIKTGLVKFTRQLGFVYTGIILLIIPAAGFFLLKRKKVTSKKIPVPPRRTSQNSLKMMPDNRAGIEEKLRQAINRIDELRQSREKRSDSEVTAYEVYAKPDNAYAQEQDFSADDDSELESTPVPVSHLSGSDSAEIEIIPPSVSTSPSVAARHLIGCEPVSVLTEDAPNKLEIIKMARRGSTISEISKRFRISHDQAELILRTSRKLS